MPEILNSVDDDLPQMVNGYRQAAATLKEVLPLDKGTSSSGNRDRLLDFGIQLDAPELSA